jgi:hypothetical protein
MAPTLRRQVAFDPPVLESETSQLEQHGVRIAKVIQLRIRTEPGETCAKPGTVRIGERFCFLVSQQQDRLDHHLPTSLRVKARIARTPNRAFVTVARANDFCDRQGEPLQVAGESVNPLTKQTIDSYRSCDGRRRGCHVANPLRFAYPGPASLPGAPLRLAFDPASKW